MSTIKVRKNPDIYIKNFGTINITQGLKPCEEFKARPNKNLGDKSGKNASKHHKAYMGRYSPEKSEAKMYKKVLLEDEKYQRVYFSSDFGRDIPLANLRRESLKWIYHIGRKFKQSSVSIQTAMIYFDRLVCKIRVKDMKHESDLWAATCLWMASKFIEVEGKRIKTDDFKRIDKKFKVKSMKQYEENALDLLDWELNCITPSYFRGIVMEEAQERSHKSREIFGHNDTLILMSNELRDVNYSTIACA